MKKPTCNICHLFIETAGSEPNFVTSHAVNFAGMLSESTGNEESRAFLASKAKRVPVFIMRSYSFGVVAGFVAFGTISHFLFMMYRSFWIVTDFELPLLWVSIHDVLVQPVITSSLALHVCNVDLEVVSGVHPGAVSKPLNISDIPT